MKMILIAHRNQSRPKEDFEPWFEPEAKKALSLMAEDFFREIYSRADGKGAVMVVEADTVEEVERRLQELPFVQNDLLSFEIYPVVPYRGIVDAAKS
ncbi:MAG: hypothetical protein R3316_03575 [Rhodovibrionaceae bacterium]|nr:hypothetical protein [Rhodovibrionaceae bacterium]